MWSFIFTYNKVHTKQRFFLLLANFFQLIGCFFRRKAQKLDGNSKGVSVVRGIGIWLLELRKRNCSG